MVIYAVPDAEKEPCLSVECWKIYETDKGTRHIVGYCIERAEGRVSSAITEFDPELRIMNTRFGREYQLVGLPGFNEEADYAWEQWKVINDVSFSDEVTASIWEQCQRSKTSHQG